MGSQPETEYDQGKMISLLLTLLDRIELEQDYTLASQRFDIARSLGLTVAFGEQISGRLN